MAEGVELCKSKRAREVLGDPADKIVEASRQMGSHPVASASA
jgi:hypothetical protein